MKRACLSTMYGVGLTRIAPGTAGSLVAILLAYPILLAPLGYAWLTLGAILFTVLGTVNANQFMRARNTTHDPQEIVIDELVGQWLTYSVCCGLLYGLAGTPAAAQEQMTEVTTSPVYIVAGFVLFRIFDILKPWPIRWADRHIKGGFGVMFDDILAAVPAGGLLYLIHLFSPVLTGTGLEINP